MSDGVFISDDEDGSRSLVLEPASVGEKFRMAAGMSQTLMYEIAGECTNILDTSKPVKILLNKPGTHALHTEIIQYRRKILPDAVRTCHVIDNVWGVISC